MSTKLAVDPLVLAECSTRLAVSPSVALDLLLFELAFETEDASEAALDFELTEVTELSEFDLLRLERLPAEIVLASSKYVVTHYSCQDMHDADKWKVNDK